MGILEVLTLIFVYMKLAGVGAVASWSWLLVLSPLIGAGVLYLCIIVIFASLYLWK